MKLTMMRGLPGSGKTTKARELVRESGNAGRINRDDLRAMLFDSVWSGKREGVVVECEKAVAKILLDNKLTPVIDDTNLSTKHLGMWHTFAGVEGVAFHSVDMKVSLEECVRRDLSRPMNDYVGKAVIHRMALFNGLIEWTKPIVICDIDGTIANGERRERWLTTFEKKNWDAYYSELGMDEPIELVINMVRALAEDHTICLVSGRPDTYQNATMDWLEEHNVPYDYLFMRPGSDRRSDVEVKQRVLDHLPKKKILVALDDRPSVIEGVWRKNNIRVIPVRGACEPF